MLKGIDPLLSGALLKALDEMGHADRLLLVDRNYPANSAGAPVIRLGEVTAVRAMTAILSVLPLDDFVERPLARMETDGDAAVTTATQDEVLRLASAEHGSRLEYEVIPRETFYAAARECVLVVHCLESEPYSCFILQKGVVFD
ncbi:RbsD/FucU family protein [Homoserinibacter sp. YIM 151385]|uniref:RbsD/FucU family protein n=1 Tax=Homoserinibacter sp. YIM 151385 TaxID=2985506 RepID=UPI0022F11934|nr:RbsD/FucU domain-containing protein [Homoserinibacter sp. YIM 151385]WBU37926.1 hypothetical protein OF852_13570 [Homoserinibacter sp. YIM 151385]